LGSETEDLQFAGFAHAQRSAKCRSLPYTGCLIVRIKLATLALLCIAAVNVWILDIALLT